MPIPPAPMILPISDPKGCDKLHPTQPPSLARIAQNIGDVSQNEGLIEPFIILRIKKLNPPLHAYIIVSHRPYIFICMQ